MSARRLPRRITVRLADIRRHYEALALGLEETSAADFLEAARLRDPELLARNVYPIERGFEILCNYVSELNELALREAGLEPRDRPKNLRLLEREQVISGQQRRKLYAMLEARNELQHQYPDVVASGIHRAAHDLVEELPRYLRAYVRWLRRLGFGPPEES